MRFPFRRCSAVGFLPVLLSLSVSCRSAGTLRDPALEEQRLAAEMFQRARVEMETGVAGLERLSIANDSSGVARFLPELARRDTIYRKLLHLRRELDPGVPAALADSVHLRSRPPLLDISPTPMFESFKDGRTWMLQGYLIHHFVGTPLVIVVPAGFVTDLASVPDVAEPLLPRNGEYSTAAIVHDYLYWTQSCTRDQADNLMAIVMKQTGVSQWKELLIYGAVRLAGQRAWDQNREQRANGTVRIIGMSWDHAPSQVDWDALQAALQQSHSRVDSQKQISPQVCALGNETSATPWHE